MEEWKKLMGDCQACLDIPNCSGVIDWKHDHIRCNERVVVNFITVRRDTVWCLLAAVYNAKLPYIDLAINGRFNDAVVFWKSSFGRGHMTVIIIWIGTVDTLEIYM